MLDHFERGKLMLSQVQILVVDEADRMLDMGFIPDVERICKLIPFTRQTLFYSATMPPEIQRLTDQFLHNAVRVEVSRPATTATNIKQEIVQIPANDWAKRESLRRLIREGDVKNAIVFCNRKRDVDVVAKSLQKHGFSAAALHGDLDQSVRTRTLDSFRSGELRFLVASDVAARGLDIPMVSHIFNFDVPFHPDDYVHRIGRTGRAGRDGHALMLATPKDNRLVEAIESLTGHPIAKRVMEDLEIREETRSSRDRSSGDRRPRREHRGSHEGASRHVPDTKREQAATHPAVRAATTPCPRAASAPAERKQQMPRHQQAAKAQASPKQPQHVDRESDDLNRLPAFVLRPVILPPKPEKPAPRTRRKVSAEA
jgi:superfamily II DNA/RNA helicase